MAFPPMDPILLIDFIWTQLFVPDVGLCRIQELGWDER